MTLQVHISTSGPQLVLLAHIFNVYGQHSKYQHKDRLNLLEHLCTWYESGMYSSSFFLCFSSIETAQTLQMWLPVRT